MSAVKEMNILLGIEVQVSKKLITISQKKYFQNVVQKFSQFYCPYNSLLPSGITAGNTPVLE
jgi:hypothetical protein